MGVPAGCLGGAAFSGGQRIARGWSNSPLADPLTLEAAQQQVDAWIHRFGVRCFAELTNLAQLMEEVGELARLVSRRYGEQSAKPGEPGDLADELADVLFVLICLANQTGVNLTQAFQRNLEKKTQRDAQRHRANSKLNAQPDESGP